MASRRAVALGRCHRHGVGRGTLYRDVVSAGDSVSCFQLIEIVRAVLLRQTIDQVLGGVPILRFFNSRCDQDHVDIHFI